jgi:major membrane immunogen (membrane-anchored lipoprotein)
MNERAKKTMGIQVMILSCLLLAGCGTTAEVWRYDNGKKIKMAEMHLNKDGAVTYKDDKIEIGFDSRKPTLWERFITPVLSAGAEGAGEAVK